MTLDEYQRAAARTMNPALAQREQLLDAAAGLAEEAGEVVGLVRKAMLQGRPLAGERLVEELGDALWCVAATATALGLSLGSIAHANLDKLRERYPPAAAPER